MAMSVSSETTFFSMKLQPEICPQLRTGSSAEGRGRIDTRYQLFFVVVKVSSNRQGQISLESRSAVKQHAVMFWHESPEKVIDLFSGGCMFDIEQMKESIQIWLPGPHHELDFLAHKVFQTCNLLAWSNTTLQEILYIDTP